jgi:ribosomal-protein-alanine N-acetyltransferase
MKSKVIFKPAAESDFEEILRLEEESFNLHDRLDRETLIELFNEFREGFHIITADGEFAGYSVFLIEDGEGYIESIAVNSNHRRRGLGILALKYMMECLKDRGFEKINLHVRMDNIAAMSLYEKEGFLRTGIVPGFYKDGEPAYLYSRKENIFPDLIKGVN